MPRRLYSECGPPWKPQDFTNIFHVLNSYYYTCTWYWDWGKCENACVCAGEYISDALHKLKTSWNPRRPQESWQPLKQLQSRLQQRAQKRAAYTIHMVDISPALAGLKDSLIAMPGVASRSGNIITVSAVDNNIAILPTKTKPKKLVFHGSDGQQ